MAAIESKFKQRIVGALVLIALAVIFLPMLFKQDEPTREVIVQAPPAPETPAAPQLQVEEVAVPEPVIDENYVVLDAAGEPVDVDISSGGVATSGVYIAEPILEEEPVVEAPKVVAPAAKPAPVKPAPAPAKPVVAKPAPVKPKPAPAKPVVTKPVQKPVAPGIDKNNLPVSWSVQLASLTNQANANAMRDTFRKKQYNAYVRSTGNLHRVMIGPLVREKEARELCKSLKSREGQDCFVVRFEP